MAGYRSTARLNSAAALQLPLSCHREQQRRRVERDSTVLTFRRPEGWYWSDSFGVVGPAVLISTTGICGGREVLRA